MSDAGLLLSLHSVRGGYGRGDILRNVTLELRRGEIRTILGANGAGKTTLLRTIVGLIKPTAGSVRYWPNGENGTTVQRWSAHSAARLGIVLVPEGRGILGTMTVEENLQMGAFHVNDRAEVRRRTDDVCSRFPILSERRRQLAASLSGGEQQMLALARGLVARPQLLLLDEPSLGLAPQVVRTVFDTIAEIHAAGTSVLLVEQNVHYGLALANWAYVLSSGEVVVQGPPQKLSANEQVRKAYLGM